MWEGDGATAFLFNTQWSGGLACERTFPWRPVGFGEPTLGYLQRSGSGDREEYLQVFCKGGLRTQPRAGTLGAPAHSIPCFPLCHPPPRPSLETRLLRERRGNCGHPFPPPLTPECQG